MRRLILWLTELVLLLGLFVTTAYALLNTIDFTSPGWWMVTGALVFGITSDLAEWFIYGNRSKMPKRPPQHVLDKINEYKNQDQGDIKVYTIVRLWHQFYR